MFFTSNIKTRVVNFIARKHKLTHPHSQQARADQVVADASHAAAAAKRALALACLRDLQVLSHQGPQIAATEVPRS